jgi:hypothetical protein
MNLLDKFSNGWTIAMASFKVIKAKKELVIFPILSGFSILVIVASLYFGMLGGTTWEADGIDRYDDLLFYICLFGFYLVNYFIVIFFNVALVHCVRLYFKGENFTIRDGLRFSMSRIGAIFSWAFLSATVGFLLKLIQENAGWLGKILVSLIGMVWSITTFFVIPVIAYEDKGPLEAVKRSGDLIRQKWGESLGGTFSFALIQFVCMLIVGVIFYVIGSFIDPVAAIVLAIVGGFFVFSIISAAEMVFVSAVYHNINGDVDDHFSQQMVDDLFEQKKKSLF